MANLDFDRLGELVREAMARLHVPGVALGIIHEAQEYTVCYGVTSVEHPLPVDADTLFQIGSTTKTVTGTAAMRLMDMGKVELHVPLRTYLPDLRLADEQAAAQVSLLHLFTHTGGWLGDYFDDLGPGDDALAKIVVKMAELPQLTPLGTVWSYNNAGFYLAGRVIEVVTGKTYETAIKELVLDPLGMTKSFFFAADAITHRVAVGHFEIDDKAVVARPWALARAAHAAGGITSSVKDQLRYARFHLGDGTAPDGTRLLKPETMRLMQTPQVAKDLGDQMGVSWMIRDVNGTRIVQHGGATNGQLSAFQLVPARGFAITVLTNANRGAELYRELTKWTLEHLLGVREAEPVHLEMSEAELSAYGGRYTTALADAELSVRDGELIMQVTPKGGFPDKSSPPPPAPPPMRLEFCGPDRVVVLDPPMKDLQGEFLRNPDGSIAWFRFGGRIRAREKSGAVHSEQSTVNREI